MKFLNLIIGGVIALLVLWLGYWLRRPRSVPVSYQQEELEDPEPFSLLLGTVQEESEPGGSNERRRSPSDAPYVSVLANLWASITGRPSKPSSSQEGTEEALMPPDEMELVPSSAISEEIHAQIHGGKLGPRNIPYPICLEEEQYDEDQYTLWEGESQAGKDYIEVPIEYDPPLCSDYSAEDVPSNPDPNYQRRVKYINKERKQLRNSYQKFRSHLQEEKEQEQAPGQGFNYHTYTGD